MDTQNLTSLAQLIRSQRMAALGTLRDGGPLVSMVVYAAAPDFSEFYLHISRLAQHTQDLLQDGRASLLISEQDQGVSDPQTLARLSLRGEAVILAPDHPNYSQARSTYLARFPQTAMNFSLGDFLLYAFQPRAGRYVAGFGQIFNLTIAHLKQASGEVAL